VTVSVDSTIPADSLPVSESTFSRLCRNSLTLGRSIWSSDWVANIISRRQSTAPNKTFTISPRQGTLFVSYLVEQGLHHVREFGDVRKTEHTGATLDGMGATEYAIDLIHIRGITIDLEQTRFHAVDGLEAFLEKGFVKFRKIRCHIFRPSSKVRRIVRSQRRPSTNAS